MNQFDSSLNDAAAVPQPLPQQVQQGSPSAMARLLNRALAHKQITAQVSIEGKGLFLSLTAPQIPNQRVATILVCREINTWKLEGIELLQITGQQRDTPQSAWKQAIAIHPLANAPLTLEQVVRVGRLSHRQKSTQALRQRFRPTNPRTNCPSNPSIARDGSQWQPVCSWRRYCWCQGN